MKIAFRLARQSRHPLAVMVSIVLALALPISVLANVAVTQISSDPYSNTDSQHATQVEPDTFSYGSTIVSASQTGRFNDGGASNIGFATSTNGGTSWTNGFLPATTDSRPSALPCCSSGNRIIVALSQSVMRE